MNAADEVVACPICASNSERKFLLRDSPLLQNVLYDNRTAALDAERGDCPIHYCAACHFAFNPKFVAYRIHYDSQYNNDQSASATYRRYLDTIADRLIADCGLSPASRVLEIACGNGYLITRIRERCGALALGYDPAWSGRYGHEDFIKAETFSPPTGFRADLVILRHCLDSFTEPDAVFGALSGALHSRSRLYVESANLDYMLDSHDFSLFYHECPRYFSISAISRYLSGHQFSLQSSRLLFDEQYFGCLFRRVPGWNGLQKAPERFRRQLGSNRRTLLWGTSGRAITLLSHLGLDERQVTACVDIAPEKQGLHVPVTGQRIISQAEARTVGAARVIVANRNYLAEVASELPPDTEILSINDIINRGTDGPD